MKKLSRPISEGEAFGSSVHNALKKWGELEKQVTSCELRVTSSQQALFASDDHQVKAPKLTFEKLLECWHSSFIVDGFPTRLEADFARKRGEQLMEHFFEWWQKEPRNVKTIETGFAIQIDGMEVKGRFDRIEEIEGGLRVIDFKTSKPQSQDSVDADLQLSLYAMAVEHEFGQPCRELILLFLSEEGIVERQTGRSPSQLIDARTQIQAIRNRIDEGDFHPTPSIEKCRSCPYRNVCDVAAV